MRNDLTPEEVRKIHANSVKKATNMVRLMETAQKKAGMEFERYIHWYKFPKQELEDRRDDPSNYGDQLGEYPVKMVELIQAANLMEIVMHLIYQENNLDRSKLVELKHYISEVKDDNMEHARIELEKI